MLNKRLKTWLGGVLVANMLVSSVGGQMTLLAADEQSQAPVQIETVEPSQVETTTPATIKVIPNPLLKLLDSSDDTSTFEQFIKLFENQSYVVLASEESKEWNDYLDKLEGSLMSEWIQEALDDEGTRKNLISQLLSILESETQFIALTSTSGKTMETVIKENLTNLYTRYRSNISFSGQNYIDLDIDSLYELDQMKKLIDPNEMNFMTDVYLSKLWFDVGVLLSEDFESSNNESFYQKVIYRLNEVHTKGIKQVSDILITGMSVEVFNPQVAMNRTTTPQISSSSDRTSDSTGNSQVVAPTDTQGAMELIAEKMKSLETSVDGQYDFYSGLDRSRLTSMILSSYQGMVDSRRGVLGSYYTGIYSPDYDATVDQADSGDTGVRLGTSFELVALKLEEKGGDFDIRRSLYGLYDEKLNNSSLHKGLKKVVYTAYIRTPELGEVSTGNETATFTFSSALNNLVGGQAVDASNGNRVSISVSKNGVEKLSKSGSTYSGTLEENTLYKFEATARVLDYVNDLPDQVLLKWSYGDVSTEVIPNRYFFVDANDSHNLTSKKNLKLVHLDPAGDADDDGLPNAWEIEGFVFDRTQNHLVKYDPQEHAGLEVYYTSPVDSSSDGDPYSDLEEVLSTNIDVISDAGKHPMVAAYPEYAVELEGLTLNARLQSKYSKTESNKTVNLNGSNNTIVNKYTRKTSLDKGFTAGGSISQSVGYVQGPAGPGPIPLVAGGVKVEGSSSAFVSGKYGKLEDNEYVTTTISSTNYSTTEDANTVEQLATTSNTFKSADLSFNIKIKNIGSATGYDIKPNLSFYIGNEVSRSNPAITTVEVPVAVDSLAPNQSSQTFEVSNTQTTDSGRKIDLTINQETYQKILKGYPITMQMNSANSEVIANNQARGPWDDYVNKINGISATINHQDSVNGLRTYKVFATKADDTVRPQFTIGMSLQNIYGSAFSVEKSTQNGESTFIYKINGKNITAINVYADDISQFAEAFTEGATVLNFFNVIVRPGMVVQVETSNTTETKPFILNATYKRGVISAYVLGNCSEVESVKASVQYDGNQHEVTLTRSEDNALLYTYEFDPIVNINTEVNNLVIAEDVNGNANEAKLYIPNAYYIKEEQSRIAYGTTYKELAEDFRITSKADAQALVEAYPAEAYVFYRSRGHKDIYQKASAIYTREQVLAYTKLGYGLGWGSYASPEIYCQGYYVSGDSGDKFRLLTNQSYPIYLKDGQAERSFSISTGAEKATSYVVMIGSTERANHEAGTVFELNGRQYKGPVWGTDILSNYMMIIDANSTDSDVITGKITVPNTGGRKKYELQVVGYYTEDAGYRYKSLATKIDLPTMASNATETIVNAINEPTIIEKPRAYLLRVGGGPTSNTHSTTHISINGVKVANSRTADNQGGFSIYVIVPNDATGNKINVDVVNPVSNPTANYDIDILGYFY